MRLIDAKRAAEAQKSSPRDLVNFAAPQPKNIFAAHAHGAAEFPLARQLIQHIEIFMVTVDKKSVAGRYFLYFCELKIHRCTRFKTARNPQARLRNHRR